MLKFSKVPQYYEEDCLEFSLADEVFSYNSHFPVWLCLGLKMQNLKKN